MFVSGRTTTVSGSATAARLLRSKRVTSSVGLSGARQGSAWVRRSQTSTTVQSQRTKRLLEWLRRRYTPEVWAQRGILSCSSLPRPAAHAASGHLPMPPPACAMTSIGPSQAGTTTVQMPSTTRQKPSTRHRSRPCMKSSTPSGSPSIVSNTSATPPRWNPFSPRRWRASPTGKRSDQRGAAPRLSSSPHL